MAKELCFGQENVRKVLLSPFFLDTGWNEAMMARD